MAESNQGSKDPPKGGGRVPPLIPPPPPAPHHNRIPPPPPAPPPLRFPPAPPRSYPPPPPPTDVPYVPLEQSSSEESVPEAASPKKEPEEKPQGAKRKVKAKSTVPVPPPLPKELPERPRVSMNPRGRDTPATNAFVDYDDDPKKGIIRTFFSKAKDYLLKKGYLPLEQHESEVYTPEMPDMLKKYTPLEDEAYRITPPRDIKKDSGAFSKLLTKGYTSSAEVTSEPESELESSADNLGFVADEPEAEKGAVHPLETSMSQSDALSEHGSMFSESGEYAEPIPIATAQYAEAAAVETEVVKPISACSASAAEADSELYRIKVSSPADIKVAYSVSGSLTTCITYETDDSAKNAETQQQSKDRK